MPHITTCLSVPLNVISRISLSITPTLDLHDRTTHCNSCSISLGRMSMGGLLDVPSAMTRPSKFTRMWEILVMIRISHRLRLPTSGMLLVKRYLGERCFHLMRNAVPLKTRTNISKIWLRPS